jgi:hypothetical protein
VTLVELLLQPIPGGITGNLAYDMLKVLAARLSGAEDKLAALLGEPYSTGIRLATEAADLPATTPQQAAFRDAQLWSAITKLEAAVTLLPKKNSAKARDARRKVYTTLALCYASLSSGAGLPVARRRWEAVREDLSGTLAGLANEAARLERDGRYFAASALRRGASPHIDIDGDGRHELRRAAERRQEAAALDLLIRTLDQAVGGG